MKYIEQVKSITLTLLVLLSIALTFFIWTYTPNYDLIEQAETQQVTIGEKKELEATLKPYKMLYRFQEEWRGTLSSGAMDGVMTAFSEWQEVNLRQIDTNVSDEAINAMMRKENRFTLFFMGDIPLQAFRSIVPFGEKELPEVSFNRIVVDWKDYRAKQLNVYFINTNKNYIYKATAQTATGLYFYETIIEPAKEYGLYEEIERESGLSLYTIDEPVEAIKYTYYIDEIQPELFKNVLFADPKLVQRNIDSSNSQKYTDGMSLMTVDTANNTLNYVYPAAESSKSILPSRLLENSFDFINEHGGMTDDYRLILLNEANHQTDYLLFLEGLPVISNETLTRISTTWGDNRVFRYKRPYFSLDMDITSEKEITALPSGQAVMEWLKTKPEQDVSELREVVIGYYLSVAENQNLYTLEPSWFYVQNGSWTRITPEMLGGVMYGLE